MDVEDLWPLALLIWEAFADNVDLVWQWKCEFSYRASEVAEQNLLEMANLLCGVTKNSIFSIDVESYLGNGEYEQEGKVGDEEWL